MKMRINKLSLLTGLLALVLASPAVHATKMLDKSTFKYDPTVTYYHSALFTRFSGKELRDHEEELFTEHEETPHEVVGGVGGYEGSYGGLPDHCVTGGGGDGEESHKIPEPGTLALFLTGIFSLFIARRYRNK